MKIIERSSVSTKFRVLRAKFTIAGGHVPAVGDELQFLTQEGQATALNLVRLGYLLPCDLPDKGEYIVVSPFFLPGKTEKYDAKAGDFVQLKAADALTLMLSRKVVPKNKKQWSPYRLWERKITPFEKNLEEVATSWVKPDYPKK